MDLVEKMKKHLPIKVYLRGEIIKHLQKEGKEVQKGEPMEVVDVCDSGDFGGIVCVIPTKKEALVVSITHLSIDPAHPLSEDIKAYQCGRVLQLQAEMRGFAM